VAGIKIKVAGISIKVAGMILVTAGMKINVVSKWYQSGWNDLGDGWNVDQCNIKVAGTNSTKLPITNSKF
jgi:hypothetical protein